MSERRVREAARTTTDPRWRAVVARDPGADGTFFYSVRTSGVYCFPSCRARLARPENVHFHRTRQDAERAGFRPCKRCKPDRRDDRRASMGKVVEHEVVERVDSPSPALQPAIYLHGADLQRMVEIDRKRVSLEKEGAL